ncbi:MAG: hypothetical protein K8S87_09870 [Planctomycetes bacterium]|nr:hypothetical protein [Planctomycetota bacterium]
MKDLRKKYPEALVVDAGNAAQSNLWWKVIEYKYLVSGYAKMGYQLLNFGIFEQLLPADDLKKILKEHKGLPFISANVQFADGETFAEPYKTLDYKGLKIGFLGITKKFDVQQGYKIKDYNKAIESYLPELVEKSDIQVLLASVDEVDGRQLIKQFPQFEIVFFGGNTTEFHVWKKTSLYGPIAMGKDGKAPFLMREGEVGRYQLFMKLHVEKGELVKIDANDIELDEKVKDDIEYVKYVYTQMEKELEKENRLKVGVFGPPGENDYTAAEDCADSICHEEQFSAWEKGVHQKAYISLLNVKRPGVFDPAKNTRCINCHTLGFGDPDGGYLSSHKIPESRRGVSCGNCHGKARTHMDEANELAEEGKLIDLKTFPEIRRPEIFTCVRCHDAVHDPDFLNQEIDNKDNFRNKLKSISEIDGFRHFNFDKTWARYVKSDWTKKYGKFDKE